MTTPREIMRAQIEQQETSQVPYALPFEPEVGLRLDEHYGGPAWRQRLTPYVVGVGAVDTDMKEPIDEVRVRDGYGGIWRQDRRPWHLEVPPLSKPSLTFTWPLSSTPPTCPSTASSLAMTGEISAG